MLSLGTLLLCVLLFHQICHIFDTVMIHLLYGCVYGCCSSVWLDPVQLLLYFQSPFFRWPFFNQSHDLLPQTSIVAFSNCPCNGLFLLNSACSFCIPSLLIIIIIIIMFFLSQKKKFLVSSSRKQARQLASGFENLSQYSCSS